MLKTWFDSYSVKNLSETNNALREIMQEIALAGLARAGFFNHAAFYGGTALRIFYQLPRYSEDLDFSLIQKNATFKMKPFLVEIESEFAALGLKVKIGEKVKSKATAIDSAFLKSDTSLSELHFIVEGSDINLNSESINIKIKLEVDTLPPLGFRCESKLLLRPYSVYINVMELSDLYAGKMHALLFRRWKTRVKGRDWFDFEWYVQRNVSLHLKHFEVRALESGDWVDDKGSMTLDDLCNLINQKIEILDFGMAREDALRFVPPADAHRLEIWSADYFKELVNRIKVL